MNFDIQPVAQTLAAELQQCLDQKTKPVGSLGRLESLALQIGLIQQTLTPQLSKPTLVVCAADHGAASHGAASPSAGISAYPSEVTAQMVLNFLNGGAAINVLAKQNGLDLTIIDTGVNYNFPIHPNLLSAKIAPGTKNYCHQAAMSQQQCRQALSNGRSLMRVMNDQGCNLVGFGEMGIGNSASAALLMALLCDLPLADCTGAGAGLDDAGINRKIAILESAQQRIMQAHGKQADPLTLLAEAGGFEIATLCGALLGAAERGMVILVDGFIVTSAVLVAQRIAPAVTDYCVFSHRSDETGHSAMLQHLNAEPLLDLGLRLGEGSGAALAYPLVQAAVNILNNMASFADAGVSGKSPTS